MTNDTKNTEKRIADFKQKAAYLKSLVNDSRKWHLAKVDSNGTYTVDINDNNVFTTDELKTFVESL